MNKKVYYGRIQYSRGAGYTPRIDFRIHGKTGTKYSKMFKHLDEKQKVRVTIEKMSDKEWTKEVYGDPR